MMTAAERRLRGRAGAYALWSQRDPHELSKAGRDAAWERFVDLVDPDRVLPEHERQRRAEAARRSHMSLIALKSVQARAARRGPTNQGRSSATTNGNARNGGEPARASGPGDDRERPPSP